MKQVGFGPRVPGTEGHIKTRDWIAEQMKKSCANVKLQELSHTWSKTGKKVTMWNIIGEQNWDKGKVKVLLLAHWDTRPYANEDPNPENRDKPILGANDGASGVAVLLELMRVMKDRYPDVGIMYLMTDGEDLGPGLDEMFLGATYFSKNLPSPKPDYGILLDMVGSKNVRITMEMNGYTAAKSLVQSFYKNARLNSLSSAFPAVYGQPIYDDHLSLIQAGVPTMDLIDFEHLEHWHNLSDTVENCSADSLGKVGKALESWLIKSPPFKLDRD